jgi:arylsulfatase
LGGIFKENGYATSWFGKNHSTPAFQASQVGPFDQWPIGMGFDYFYGFVGGDTNQWQPNLGDDPAAAAHALARRGSAAAKRRSAQ